MLSTQLIWTLTIWRYGKASFDFILYSIYVQGIALIEDDLYAKIGLKVEHD
jgi:hypothetical protein